jgi:hypothetical protein
MNRLIIACSAAAMCATGALAAVHTPITITGCVHAGIEPDTYVLLNVDEVTGGHAAPAGAVYWLSSTAGLRGHIGHKVEVRGTYSLARVVGGAAPKIKSGDVAGRRTIALENGETNSATTPTRHAAGTTDVFPTEVKAPYRRLEVVGVRMIEEGCAAL